MNGVLLVYDITRPDSFGNLKFWLRQIQDRGPVDVENIMILGNKCDMEEQRQISKEQGEAFAQKNGLSFLETSAKNNVNVEEAFLQMSERSLDKVPGEKIPDTPMKKPTFFC